MKRKIAAILAADVAGYSRLVAEAEEETLQRLGDYRAVFEEFVGRYGGRIFNTAGDAVMCEFESAVECVRAAIDIQESLRTRNLVLPPHRRLEFRIGITIGDVVERDGDLLGDGVNIAARLESLAPPGGICVSRSVHEAVANKVSIPFRDLGAREVKNMPNPLHAFVAAWPGPVGGGGSGAGRLPLPVSVRRGWPWFAGATATALIAASAAIVILRPPEPLPAPTPVNAIAEAPPLPPRRPNGTAPQRAANASDPAEAFAVLARQAVIVAEPKTAAEHYHNARLHEARGDASAARRAYRALALTGEERLDPHLRYAALLRVGESRAGAREQYAALLRDKPTPAAALVHALLFDDTERRAKIAGFVAAHPDFAPAHHLLAEEYGEGSGGLQTIDDRRIAIEALKAFLKAEAEGRLHAYFLDHTVLAAWLDKARRRHAALETFFQTAPTRPIARFARSRSGWTAALSLPEPATVIAYRVGEGGEFRRTGYEPHPDPHTGKLAPKAGFDLPRDQPATTLHLTYEDANGRPAGPFPIGFDPREALVSAGREALERQPGAWLAFRDGRHPVLDFSGLIGHHCALDRAILALDDGPFGIELPLPPCDEKELDIAPVDGAHHVSVPPATRSASLQLFFADGIVSGVRTFQRE